MNPFSLMSTIEPLRQLWHKPCPIPVLPRAMYRLNGLHRHWALFQIERRGIPVVWIIALIAII
ncbi:MAG TPA: hypothetical protein DEV93_04460 [Chloroflexi bacterium]|nr:hypothetical protein [Chloroflexota bacterium]